MTQPPACWTDSWHFICVPGLWGSSASSGWRYRYNCTNWVTHLCNDSEKWGAEPFRWKNECSISLLVLIMSPIWLLLHLISVKEVFLSYLKCSTRVVALFFRVVHAKTTTVTLCAHLHQSAHVKSTDSQRAEQLVPDAAQPHTTTK